MWPERWIASDDWRFGSNPGHQSQFPACRCEGVMFMSDLDDVSSGISTWLIRSPSKRGCLLTSFFEKPNYVESATCRARR